MFMPPHGHGAPFEIQPDAAQLFQSRVTPASTLLAWPCAIAADTNHHPNGAAFTPIHPNPLIFAINFGITATQ
jgi:hypothetical protein